MSLQTRTSARLETTRARQTPTAATRSGRTGASVTTATRETASRATVGCKRGAVAQLVEDRITKSDDSVLIILLPWRFSDDLVANSCCFGSFSCRNGKTG